MNFVLKFEKDLSTPVACCELCGTEITDAELAMVYWRREDYQQELHAPLLVHKRCMRGRPAREERYELSMELMTYLAFLLQNVGMTGEKLARAFNLAGLERQRTL